MDLSSENSLLEVTVRCEGSWNDLDIFKNHNATDVQMTSTQKMPQILFLKCFPRHVGALCDVALMSCILELSSETRGCKLKETDNSCVHSIVSVHLWTNFLKTAADASSADDLPWRKFGPTSDPLKWYVTMWQWTTGATTPTHFNSIQLQTASWGETVSEPHGSIKKRNEIKALRLVWKLNPS